METTKSFYITKQIVVEAYKRVKANKGAAGVDDESIVAFEVKLKDNLYKIWNRLSSGSYFPPPVKTVEIPKSGGGSRILGIPTVSDRIAQMVVRLTLEPIIEPYFHKDSYGYRPGKSALEAVDNARQRCWKYDWVINLDIKGFFDNINHDLVIKAVEKHTSNKWVILYIKRWLKAPTQQTDKTIKERTVGTPQGGVISPLLANLFLHYVFDKWMERNYPCVPFERYADDCIAHCKTYEDAVNILEKIKLRFKNCHLEVHPTKTKIVYCKDNRRKGEFENITFDFLGYTFRPRKAISRGQTFIGFNPAVSKKARKKMVKTIRKWRIHLAINKTLEEIAKGINPVVRGWMNYYGRWYPSILSIVLCHLNDSITRWVKKKYKRMRRRHRKAKFWLGKIAEREPSLFCHWKMVKPLAER